MGMTILVVKYLHEDQAFSNGNRPIFKCIYLYKRPTNKRIPEKK
jgi:hypothetical protein